MKIFSASQKETGSVGFAHGDEKESCTAVQQESKSWNKERTFDPAECFLFLRSVTVRWSMFGSVHQLHLHQAQRKARAWLMLMQSRRRINSKIQCECQELRSVENKQNQRTVGSKNHRREPMKYVSAPRRGAPWLAILGPIRWITVKDPRKMIRKRWSNHLFSS